MKKLVSGAVTSEATFLHHEGLGSVRAVTNAAGVKSETALYRPYGEQSEQVWTALLNEAKGFIGERYDADAGLQYLNARYYDPRLGMFLQPDWWEVMQAGVGTNRYSYSFNDPVNGKDMSGHAPVGFNIDPNYQPDVFDDIMVGVTFGGAALIGALTAPEAVLGLAARYPGAAITAMELGFTEATGMTVGASSIVVGGTKVAMSFAQKNYRETFSKVGGDLYSKMAGQAIRTIDDLAGAIRSGKIDPAKIGLEVVRRNGVGYVLNTRTATALERAGIPRKKWKFKDMTGNVEAEQRLTDQLGRNGIKPGDTFNDPRSQSGHSAGKATGGGGGFLKGLKDLWDKITGG